MASASLICCTFGISELNASAQDVKIMLTQGFEGSFATINNPLHIPVQVKFSEDIQRNSQANIIVDATSTVRIPLIRELPENLSYQWVVGSPTVEASAIQFSTPFAGTKNRPITQAFNGKFSHSGKENRYAVDIQMPVGTPVTAAKKGTVFEVIDTYSESGLDRSLVSKANAISIVHKEGYYTVYAHLQQGSARVKVGDIVEEGQQIASSGDTGYVQGPHLHFAVLSNDNFETTTLPFRFMDNGKLLKPKKGVWLSPRQPSPPPH